MLICWFAEMMTTIIENIRLPNQPSLSPAEPFAKVRLGQAFEGWVPWAQGLKA